MINYHFKTSDRFTLIIKNSTLQQINCWRRRNSKELLFFRIEHTIIIIILQKKEIASRIHNFHFNADSRTALHNVTLNHVKFLIKFSPKLRRSWPIFTRPSLILPCCMLLQTPPLMRQFIKRQCDLLNNYTICNLLMHYVFQQSKGTIK